MHHFEDMCHHSIHWYANVVLNYVYYCSNVLFWCFIDTCCRRHAKTCLILCGGIVISGVLPSLKNLAGIMVALAGVVLYGYFKSLDAAEISLVKPEESMGPKRL